MNARTTFGRTLAIALTVSVSQALAPVALAAGSHLVDTQQVSIRLAEESAARQERVKLVQDVLDGEQVRHQAGVLGMSVDRMRAAVPHLSDAELNDLGQRAQNVKDVAAGYHDDTVLIVGVTLLLVALLVLVAANGDGYYDDCYCY